MNCQVSQIDKSIATLSRYSSFAAKINRLLLLSSKFVDFDEKEALR
jgi:hypothetical protein